MLETLIQIHIIILRRGPGAAKGEALMELGMDMVWRGKKMGLCFTVLFLPACMTGCTEIKIASA